jgi:16S rRNA A1518/A1519 N6-dimethyltransferase RsmA/KsgA/DIM1 with predicted DNA glycosylase/AP lyase activity
MHKQQGMSIIGLLLTGLIIIFLGITIMRIIPVYVQYFTILQSVKALKEMPASDFSPDPEVNSQLLKNSLLKRFTINDIDEKNFQEMSFARKDDSTYNVVLKYKVIKPLIANVSLLFDFTISQEVTVAKS